MLVRRLAFRTEHTSSEAGSVPVLRWKAEETPTELCPLGRHNLGHCTSLIIPKLSVSPPHHIILGLVILRR
jgi:hypothetical protein